MEPVVMTTDEKLASIELAREVFGLEAARELAKELGFSEPPADLIDPSLH